MLVEAEFPEDIINSRLDHAVAILENLLKPVVWIYCYSELRNCVPLSISLSFLIFVNLAAG